MSSGDRSFGTEKRQKPGARLGRWKSAGRDTQGSGTQGSTGAKAAAVGASDPLLPSALSPSVGLHCPLLRFLLLLLLLPSSDPGTKTSVCKVL